MLDEDGLLPVSVSHEGYLAQPVHSYWDDFWALRGLHDAVELARAARRASSRRSAGRRCAARFARLAVRLDRGRPARERNLDFIPGSIEWADFDPTATANAIYLLDVPEGLNRTARRSNLRQVSRRLARKRSGAVRVDELHTL